MFAGGTVVIATAALALRGLGVLTSIGLSTAMMVFFAAAAAITLLPAVLSLLGDRIDKSEVIRRHRPAKPVEDSAWWRYGHRVSGPPWPYALGAVVALLAIATPTLWIHTAFPAAGDAPAETTHRQANDLLAEGFGTGFNGPLLAVIDLDAPGVGADGLDALTPKIDAIPRIASVSEPQFSADGHTVVFSAAPTTGPADPDTSIAIDQVRDLIPTTSTSRESPRSPMTSTRPHAEPGGEGDSRGGDVRRSQAPEPPKRAAMYEAECPRRRPQRPGTGPDVIGLSA